MQIQTQTRTYLIGGLILALVLVPLGVGYATAPCDAFGAPVVLSPYRLRQQHYLDRTSRWLDDVAEVGATLAAVAHGPQPQATGTAFRLAERVGQAAGRLETLAPPEAPEAYSLLALTLEQVRDTYAYAAEQLLVTYGSSDVGALAEARAGLAAAQTVLDDARAGIAGLTYPLCREVWRADP
jgi:hypothetical protein